jgi:hypothetical protein
LRSKILLWLRLTFPSVQPDQHGRILSDCNQQITELAEPLLPEQLDLAEGLRRILRGLGVHHPSGIGGLDDPGHLGVGRGEMVVPEQGHFLPQRRGRVDHPEQPALAGVVDDEVGREGPWVVIPTYPGVPMLSSISAAAGSKSTSRLTAL